MIGVVWLGNRNTTTSHVAHAWSGRGGGLKGGGPALQEREEMFAFILLLPLMDANSPVKLSSWISLIFFFSSTSQLLFPTP